MDYCPTEKMWCDILNKKNQVSPYRLDVSHLMNIPVDYDDGVERKATHPALLDTKNHNNIMVPSCNRNIPKADPNPVRRSVLGSGLEEVRWDSAQIPRQKGLYRTSKENISDKILLNNKKDFG